AKSQNRVAEERIVDAHDHAGRSASSTDLLNRQRVADVVQSPASIRLGHRHSQKRQLGKLVDRLARPLVLGIPSPRIGNQLALAELAAHSLRLALNLGQFEIHAYEPLKEGGRLARKACIPST